MKKLIIILLPVLILSGCELSLIKLGVYGHHKIYPMFGKSPDREFYMPVEVGDSLSRLWETGINGGLTSSSATVCDTFLFVNDLSGWVTCINLNSGKIAGRLKAKGASYSSPVINFPSIIFPVAENNENYTILNFYNFRDGEEMNKAKIPGKVVSELIKTDSSVIFTNEDGIVFKYSLYGYKTWENNTKIKTHSSPALNNGIIVFGNDAGEVIGMNESNGKQRYVKKFDSPFYGSPSISGDTIYIGNNDGILYALNLKTGIPFWKYNTGSKIYAVPVFNENYVFIENLLGEIFCLNKNNGSLIWEIKTGGLTNTTPLLLTNYLLVPEVNGKLFFINPVKGKIEKTINLEVHCRLSPLIVNNKLIIGSDNDKVIAYEFID